MPTQALALPCVTLVGGGNIASALLRRLLGSGWSRAMLTVVEPSESQAERIRQGFGIDPVADIDYARPVGNVVIWALKPHLLREEMLRARPFASQALHISVAAGVRLTEISQWSDAEQVVRAMPNTAVSEGLGVIGLLASDRLGATGRAWVERIFSSMGCWFWVASDQAMDAVTAVTGSGPAYVFHFLQAWQAAAEAMGFEAEQARRLVVETARGALAQAESGGTALAELRRRVTSPNGTTEAALKVLDEFEFSRSITLALRAAFNRASEISRELAA